MDYETIQFGFTALLTLLVVVDPLGAAPVFVAVTQELSLGQRRRTALRAATIAFGIAIFFLVAGQAILSYLGVSVHAFAISGGILLFATAFPMLFGKRPGLQAPEPSESGRAGEDIAIFPLATPLLTGPGAITTILLLTAKVGTDLLGLGLLVVAIGLVYGVVWMVLYTAEQTMARLGEGRIHVMTRVMGIVLAALAVQFVLNGITGYYVALIPR